MNCFTSWMKTFNINDETAAQILGLGNKVTLYRYKKGRIPNGNAAFKMLIAALTLDSTPEKERFEDWVVTLLECDEGFVSAYEAALVAKRQSKPKKPVKSKLIEPDDGVSILKRAAQQARLKKGSRE